MAAFSEGLVPFLSIRTDHMTVRVPPSYAHSVALSVVALFAKFKVVEDATVAAPTAGSATGLAAASRAVISLDKARAKQLLFDGTDDFVALADSLFEGADPAAALVDLQAQLDGSSYLLNNALTLADVVVFLALHPTIHSQSARDDLIDVVRWAIQIQSVVASPLPPITAPVSIAWGTPGPKERKTAPPTEREAKVKGKQKPPPPPTEPEDKFALLDIRVAQIVRVWPHPKADTLYCEEIDIGAGQVKRVVTGVRNFIPIEQMENRRCVVFANIRPGKIRDEPSDAMVFAASDQQHTKVELLEPPADTPIGTRVTCAGFAGGEGKPPVDKNGKAWKSVADFLTVNAERIACYKGVPLAVPEGPITVETLASCSFH
jgi:tRNA-binding EMAP/Myf-like protein